jgi:hypothetical protein
MLQNAAKQAMARFYTAQERAVFSTSKSKWGIIEGARVDKLPLFAHRMEWNNGEYLGNSLCTPLILFLNGLYAAGPGPPPLLPCELLPHPCILPGFLTPAVVVPMEEPEVAWDSLIRLDAHRVQQRQKQIPSLCASLSTVPVFRVRNLQFRSRKVMLGEH